MVLWDYTGTNGNEGDGGGGGGESYTQKRLLAGLVLFAMLKWGTVNLWGEAVTSVLEV